MYPKHSADAGDVSNTYEDINTRMQRGCQSRTEKKQEHFRRALRDERRDWKMEALRRGKTYSSNSKYSASWHISDNHVQHKTSVRQDSRLQTRVSGNADENKTGFLYQNENNSISLLNRHKDPTDGEILRDRKPKIERGEIVRSQDEKIKHQINGEMAIEHMKPEVEEDKIEAKSNFPVEKEAELTSQIQSELILIKEKLLKEKEREIKNEIEKEMIEKKKQLIKIREEETVLEVEKEISVLKARMLQDREKETQIQVEKICIEKLYKMEKEYIDAATEGISKEFRERESFLRSEMKKAMVAKLENESDDMALRILREKSQEIERSLQQNILEMEINIRSQKEKEVKAKVEMYAREYEESRLQQIREKINREIRYLEKSVRGKKEIEATEKIESEIRKIQKEDEYTISTSTVVNIPMDCHMSVSGSSGRKNGFVRTVPIETKQKQSVGFYGKQVGPDLKNNLESCLRKTARDVVRKEVERKCDEHDSKMRARTIAKINKINGFVGPEKPVKIKEMKSKVTKDLIDLEKMLRRQIEEKIKKEISLVESCMKLEGEKAIKEIIDVEVKKCTGMFKSIENPTGEVKPTPSKKLQRQNEIYSQRNEKKQNQRRYAKAEKKKQEKKHKACVSDGRLLYRGEVQTRPQDVPRLDLSLLEDN